MSKNPVYRQWHLAANPKIAGSIRHILAEELQSLAQVTAARQKGFLLVKPDSRLHFFEGKTKLIKASHIAAFGNELKAKGLLHGVQALKDGAHYYPTEAGWAAFRTGNPWVHRAPPTIYTPDLRTSQKTVLQKKIAAKKKSIQSIPASTSPDNDAALPLSRNCLIPLLRAAQYQLLRAPELILAAARQMNFPENQIKLRKPTNTNQTFALRAQRAMDYLVSHGYLKRNGKTLATTDKARRIFQGHLLDVTWPDFKEPRVHQHPEPKETPAPKTYPDTKKARFSGKVVVPSILGNITSIASQALVTMWQNANRMLSKRDQAGSHEKAQTVIDRVTAEWDRRSANGRAEDYFRWPTTKATGGDGALTLDRAEKEGMLAYLEYHVGRTYGQAAHVRQSTLTRVFEHSLPPVFDKLYLSMWGPNGSAQRLQKIAESIAAFTRNAKRRAPDALDEAIRQWEQDLKFLHDRYYVSKFHFDFAWPTTSIS